MGPFASLLVSLSLLLCPLAAREQKSGGESCPFSCFLSTARELDCSTSANATNATAVVCLKDSINDRFEIGNRISVRRIVPGGLKNLNQFASSDGTLSLFLNMNVMELNNTSFSGLEDVLSNLEVLQVGTIHPDSLLNFSKLTSLTFDSEKIPQLPSDIKSQADVPTFLRLQPHDPNMPIEVNMDVRCHKCSSEQPITKSTILAFPLKPFQKSGGMLDALTMIYVDNCPTLEEALGCPKNTSMNEYVLNINASTGWDVVIEEVEDAAMQMVASSNSKRMRPLLLSVIIWCTVLTILLVCLIVTLVIRRKVRAKKRQEERRNAQNHRCSNTSLKHIICGTASCEDLQRASLSNGGTWIYETPSQNSCLNLLSETRSQYSIRPLLFHENGYPYLRNSMYPGELPPGYRASIPDFVNILPKSKTSIGKADGFFMNGDSGLPPLPTTPVFKVSGTPSYKRSHDGTFKLVQ